MMVVMMMVVVVPPGRAHVDAAAPIGVVMMMMVMVVMILHKLDPPFVRGGRLLRIDQAQHLAALGIGSRSSAKELAFSDGIGAMDMGAAAAAASMVPRAAMAPTTPAIFLSILKSSRSSKNISAPGRPRGQR